MLERAVPPSMAVPAADRRSLTERFHQWDCGGKQRWFPVRPFGEESNWPKTRNIERKSVNACALTGQLTRTSSTHAGAEKEKPRAFGAVMACFWTIVMHSWPVRAAFAGSARSIAGFMSTIVMR